MTGGKDRETLEALAGAFGDEPGDWEDWLSEAKKAHAKRMEPLEKGSRQVSRKVDKRGCDAAWGAGTLPAGENHSESLSGRMRRG